MHFSAPDNWKMLEGILQGIDREFPDSMEDLRILLIFLRDL
jgi:hypothetical protein